MARHLVHSFILTAVLSPFVNAGPCRPSSSSAASSATVGTTTTEHSTLTGSTLSTDTIVTISETATSSSGDATSTAEDATSTEQSTLIGSGLSTETTVTLSESVTSNSHDATSTEQSTLTGSTLSIDTTITASETATLSSEGTTKTEESTVTGSAASSTDITITIRESAATTTATTCTPAEPPVYTETEDFMMTTMFEDAITTTTAAEPPATTTEAYECVDNLKEPSPSGAICGTKGYPQGLSDGGRDLQGRAADTLLDCYKLCQEQPNCETFYFTGDYCELYKGTFSSVYEEDVSLRTYETRCFCDTGIEPAPTCEDTNPIINGGWDDGKFSPWDYYSRASGRDIVDFKIKAGGQGDSAYRFQTGNFHFDKSMWIYQDVKACPGITFTCTFNWWWDKYYAIRQNDGSRLVPYVRIYQDEDDYALTSRYPTSEDDTMRWMQGSFRFTVPDSGETRIWYIASSPQGEWLNTSDDPCKPEWVHRPNALALDSMVCYRN
ncbi:hypothetical protein HG530_010603 [Fusarium avenaceum]|nr:hypothetical protein HG530_010603 [Fusarium avenaceum]